MELTNEQKLELLTSQIDSLRQRVSDWEHHTYEKILEIEHRQKDLARAARTPWQKFKVFVESQRSKRELQKVLKTSANFTKQLVKGKQSL